MCITMQTVLLWKLYLAFLTQIPSKKSHFLTFAHPLKGQFTQITQKTKFTQLSWYLATQTVLVLFSLVFVCGANSIEKHHKNETASSLSRNSVLVTLNNPQNALWTVFIGTTFIGSGANENCPLCGLWITRETEDMVSWERHCCLHSLKSFFSAVPAINKLPFTSVVLGLEVDVSEIIC